MATNDMAPDLDPIIDPSPVPVEPSNPWEAIVAADKLERATRRTRKRLMRILHDTSLPYETRGMAAVALGVERPLIPGESVTRGDRSYTVAKDGSLRRTTPRKTEERKWNKWVRGMERVIEANSALAQSVRETAEAAGRLASAVAARSAE